MSYKVQIKGLGRMMSRIAQIDSKGLEIVDDEMSVGAVNMARTAKRLAPVDEGFLRSHIGADISRKYEKEFFASAFYAAYMEFGTRSKVKIPAGYEEFAAKYKGKANRGNIMQFFYRLVAWVRRKGISGTYSVKTRRRTGSMAKQANQDYQTAYQIMQYILKYGVNPQPFFIPAFQQEAPKVIDRIRKQFKNI